MATTRNRSAAGGSRGGSRNGGRNGGRQPKKDNTLLYIEIGGAAILAIVLIVIFAGGSSEKAPVKEPEKPKVDWRIKEDKQARKEEPKKSTRPTKRVSFVKDKALSGRDGKPPARPCPDVDLKPGFKLYKEAKKLYDLQEKQRNSGKTAEARKNLRKSYELLEEAIATVDKFNDWIEEADMEDWAVSGPTRRTKAAIDRWFKLRSIIHKVLPKTE